MTEHTPHAPSTADLKAALDHDRYRRLDEARHILNQWGQHGWTSGTAEHAINEIDRLFNPGYEEADDD